uniref:Protein kinase domain-containing protein n=1 Tax=Amphiprion ocellaris TaxID=80972 RepID=A0A3Q1B4M3_AMPOC
MTSQSDQKKLLGNGGFGVVARCRNVNSQEVVALKSIHKELNEDGKAEAEVMYKLRQLDADKHNLVKFIEHFEHKGQFCLTFEMLDLSLFDFLIERKLKPLHVAEIRVIAHQMFLALEALKSIGLAHCDIKPDNIMLVNHCSQPFKVKLIDFGCAKEVSALARFDSIQTLSYRAPEVILGLPLTEAVDMWALGSVLATLFLGRHFYPGESEYEQLRIICMMQGLPKDHLLNAGRKARKFFTESSGKAWRMKAPGEYQQDTGKAVKQCPAYYEAFNSLNDLLKARSQPMETTEEKDHKAFISLLKQMLHFNPKKRITPSMALGHRFITMKHLSGKTCDKLYVAKARLQMTRCQLEMAALDPLATSSKVPSWDEASSSENDSEGSSGASLDQVSRRKTYILESKSGTDDPPTAPVDQDLSRKRTYILESSGGTDETTTPLVEVVENNRKSISKRKGGTKDQTTAVTQKQDKVTKLTALLDLAVGKNRTSKSKGGIKNQITAVVHQQEKITKLTPPLENPSVHDGVKKNKRITAGSPNICEDRPPQEVAVTNITPAKNVTDKTDQIMEEKPSDIMEVRSKKKYFRRIRKFCSKQFKRFFSCCRGVDDD